MSAAERRLVAGKLSAIGLAIAITGLKRGSRVLVLAGGVAIGAGLRLAPAGDIADS